MKELPQIYFTTQNFKFCIEILLVLFKPQGLEGTLLVSLNGKAVPLQAWTEPEGSRRLRLPDFMTISTRRW